MEHIGPFTFNGVRFGLGSLALAVFLGLRRGRVSTVEIERSSNPSRFLIRAGLLSGLVLFGGASFQQVGIVYTTAGKAGFITGLYVVIVPILGLLWGQRIGYKTWFGAVLAVGGLYLLSFRGIVNVSPGDVLVLISAFFWAGHVLTIGWFSPRTDFLVLACLQFAICSLLSLVVALFIEVWDLQAIFRALIPILYAGLLSTGVAYTLQVAAQRRVPPAHASIIMSLEAVFAALGGWLLLKEIIPVRGLVGCCLMLGGMVISQMDPRQIVTD
jgi:drug/metabolite transporter (DMT)-like permease